MIMNESTTTQHPTSWTGRSSIVDFVRVWTKMGKNNNNNNKNGNNNTHHHRRCRYQGTTRLSQLLPLSMLWLLSLTVSSVTGGRHTHVYTDSFPPNDEYDMMALDPESPYGSPYGGFSRATASRLASLPLRLPNTGEELDNSNNNSNSNNGNKFEPIYMTVRDSQGRPFACRVYHEDELVPASLKGSLFDMPILAVATKNSPTASDADAASDDDDNVNDNDVSARKEKGDTIEKVETSTTELMTDDEKTMPTDASSEQIKHGVVDDDQPQQTDSASSSSSSSSSATGSAKEAEEEKLGINNNIQKEGETATTVESDDRSKAAGGPLSRFDPSRPTTTLSSSANIHVSVKPNNVMIVADNDVVPPNEGNQQQEQSQQPRPPNQWQDDPVLATEEITRRLYQLTGFCAQIHPNWWSYQWCHEDKVTQFHVQIVSTNTANHGPTNNNDGDNYNHHLNSRNIELQDITNLGTYHGRKIVMSSDLKDEESRRLSLLSPSDDAGTIAQRKLQELDFAEDRIELGRVIDTFTDGAICPETNKPRETVVTLRCCSKRIMDKTRGGVMKDGRPIDIDFLSMAQAKEDRHAVCHYNINICTTLLCADPHDTTMPYHQHPPDVNGDPTGTNPMPTVPVGSTLTSGTGATPTSGTEGGLGAGTMLRKDGMKFNFQLHIDPTEVEKMSVMDVLERSFGTGGMLCFQSSSGGWWVYEFCPGQHVRQFHESAVMDTITGHVSSYVESEHILGRYIAEDHPPVPKEDEWVYVVNVTDPSSTSATGGASSWNSKNKASRQSRTTRTHSTITTLGGNGAYYYQEYTKGDVCDHEDVTDSAIKAGEFGEGGIERSTTVRYSCGKFLEMAVREDSTCHYIVDISIPALCNHPLFKAPVSKKQVIKCLPLF